MSEAFIDSYIKFKQRVNICCVDLCSSPWPADSQLLDIILTGGPFLHHQCSEFVGFWCQVSSLGLTSSSQYDLGLESFSFIYYFSLMARCSIMLGQALSVTKLFLDGWEDLLLKDDLVPFFIRCRIVSEHPHIHYIVRSLLSPASTRI